jgi:hypothetical protein
LNEQEREKEAKTDTVTDTDTVAHADTVSAFQVIGHGLAVPGDSVLRFDSEKPVLRRDLRSVLFCASLLMDTRNR